MNKYLYNQYYDTIGNIVDNINDVDIMISEENNANKDEKQKKERLNQLQFEKMLRGLYLNEFLMNK